MANNVCPECGASAIVNHQSRCSQPAYVAKPVDDMTTDEIVGEMGRIAKRMERAWWAAYDQRFWHTVAHGDKCCCVLPAINL